MIALSIQQPWAWLVASGWKHIENRTWQTKYRGPLLIHAGKKIDEYGLNYVRRRFPTITLPTSFQLGGIVGRAYLADCITQSNSEWFEGPFGFVLLNAQILPFHPVRGQLGFFDVDYPHAVTR